MRNAAMPVTRFACPACHLILQPGNPLEEGRKVKCQECGVIFPVKQLDEAQIPQPAVAAAVAVPTPRSAPKARRRHQEQAPQWQEYERRQEQNRNVMLAVGSVLALLLVSGLVVGLIALSGGKDVNKRVATNDRSSSTTGSGRSSGAPAVPPANDSGPAAPAKSDEEDESAKDTTPKEQPPASNGPSVAGNGPGAAGNGPGVASP